METNACIVPRCPCHRDQPLLFGTIKSTAYKFAVLSVLSTRANYESPLNLLNVHCLFPRGSSPVRGNGCYGALANTAKIGERAFRFVNVYIVSIWNNLQLTPLLMGPVCNILCLLWFLLPICFSVILLIKLYKHPIPCNIESYCFYMVSVYIGRLLDNPYVSHESIKNDVPSIMK